MGSTTQQKYSLKWNDFGVNVATTFRDLHAHSDFADVTLACAEGSTLEAHKVILSSVSTYFRDILKSTTCEHPIVILKDTAREVAQAMLEVAYTGEVNVAQELLPALLDTARCFRIKGLDKVESPPLEPPPAHSHSGIPHQSSVSPVPQIPASTILSVPPPTVPQQLLSAHLPPVLPHNIRAVPPPPGLGRLPPPPIAWNESSNDAIPGLPLNTSSTPACSPIPPPIPLMPNGNHATRPYVEHLLNAAEKNINGRRPRELSPPSTSGRLSQSHTPRSGSPIANGGGQQGLLNVTTHSNGSSRTPPPKRWKRSFDSSNNAAVVVAAAVGASTSGGSAPIKEETPEEVHEMNGISSSNLNERRASSSAGGASTSHHQKYSYPHSMPASPTIFERGNENQLAVLFRHHLGQQQQNNSSEVTTSGSAPVDYTRKTTSKRGGSNEAEEEELDQQRRLRYIQQQQPNLIRRESEGEANGFRPESAPTVLDMSSDSNGLAPPPPPPQTQPLLPPVTGSSGPNTTNQTYPNQSQDLHSLSSNNGDAKSEFGEEIDCELTKGFTLTPDGGRYSCDQCGKIFKHPGSLQHHRHIHRGTHRCPSCGKAFSRRWDMERHLNKSKYGCPANRFSAGSNGSNGDVSSSSSPNSDAAALMAAAAQAAAVAAVNSQQPINRLELLSAASSIHNTSI